jgi:integrase/recombinase XerC
MALHVEQAEDGHRLGGGGGSDVAVVNRFLAHLAARGFSPATVRAYAFDTLNFLRFCDQRGLDLGSIAAGDLFEYLDWQAHPDQATPSQKVVRIDRRRGAAPATMNRRIAAVRGLFEYLVVIGGRASNPVPAARRSSGLRASRRGLLGHLGPGRPRSGGQLVRQPRRLPESLEAADVDSFLIDLATHRDRAIVLAMLLGGLRSGEVRSLRLADVDMGCIGCGWSARAARSGSCRLIRRSSPSALPTCVRNGRPGAAPWSASSCCGARPPVDR